MTHCIPSTNSHLITPPNEATFQKDYSQLAQINLSSGEYMYVYWRKTMREIGIHFRGKFIAQSDNTPIVDTFANLFGIPSYMFRMDDVIYYHATTIDKAPTAEKVYHLYTDTWSYFANSGTCLDFVLDIDPTATTFPDMP
jgi:hypothetical protein